MISWHTSENSFKFESFINIFQFFVIVIFVSSGALVPVGIKAKFTCFVYIVMIEY